MARLRPDELAVQRLRELCLALPEVTERPSHGEPAFFVRDKTLFVTLDDHHHGAAHLADDPDRYYRPPYVGHRGWLAVRIDREPDWTEVAELVRDAYRQVAPKVLRAQLDVTSA